MPDKTLHSSPHDLAMAMLFSARILMLQPPRTRRLTPRRTWVELRTES